MLLAVLVILLVVLPLIGFALWTLVSVAIVGAIIGGLARLIIPGRQDIGVLATVLLGWIGSLVGGFLGYRVIGTGRLPTVLLEIAVAVVLIGLYSGSFGRGLTARSGGARRVGGRW